jgi:hypothetical protein
MEARGKALAAFYDGPVWQKHRDAANATMLDSSNVLLLRIALGQAFVANTGDRSEGAVYGVVMHYLRSTESTRFAAFYEDKIAPRLRAMSVSPIAILEIETATNNFPRLPVRERDNAFVWIARWPNEQAHRDFVSKYHNWSGWRDSAAAEVLPALMEKPEILRLEPTPRSRLQ